MYLFKTLEDHIAELEKKTYCMDWELQAVQTCWEDLKPKFNNFVLNPCNLSQRIKILENKFQTHLIQTYQATHPTKIDLFKKDAQWSEKIYYLNEAQQTKPIFESVWKGVVWQSNQKHEHTEKLKLLSYLSQKIRAQLPLEECITLTEFCAGKGLFMNLLWEKYLYTEGYKRANLHMIDLSYPKNICGHYHIEYGKVLFLAQDDLNKKEETYKLQIGGYNIKRCIKKLTHNLSMSLSHSPSSYIDLYLYQDAHEYIQICQKNSAQKSSFYVMADPKERRNLTLLENANLIGVGSENPHHPFMDEIYLFLPYWGKPRCFINKEILKNIEKLEEHKELLAKMELAKEAEISTDIPIAKLNEEIVDKQTHIYLTELAKNAREAFLESKNSSRKKLKKKFINRLQKYPIHYLSDPFLNFPYLIEKTAKIEEPYFAYSLTKNRLTHSFPDLNRNCFYNTNDRFFKKLSSHFEEVL